MKFNYQAFKAIYLHEMDRFKRCGFKIKGFKNRTKYFRKNICKFG